VIMLLSPYLGQGVVWINYLSARMLDYMGEIDLIWVESATHRLSKIVFGAHTYPHPPFSKHIADCHPNSLINTLHITVES
jgi:hypothetical protein